MNGLSLLIRPMLRESIFLPLVMVFVMMHSICVMSAKKTASELVPRKAERHDTESTDNNMVARDHIHVKIKPLKAAFLRPFQPGLFPGEGGFLDENPGVDSPSNCDEGMEDDQDDSRSQLLFPEFAEALGRSE